MYSSAETLNRLKEDFDRNNDIQLIREPVKYLVISFSVTLFVSTCVARSIYISYCSVPREMLKPIIQTMQYRLLMLMLCICFKMLTHILIV